ncbi:MAG: hypothetical protein QM791_06440 [Ferruginibacter sp.]
MRKLLSLFIILSCTVTAAWSQKKFIKIKLLPFSITGLDSNYYKGKIVQGKKWEDKNGVNILLLTTAEIKYETPQAGTFGDDEGKTELYAYHFVMKDTPQLLWKVYDHVGWCGLDVVCEFYKNSLTITDLDKNGEAESCFLYALSCKGDVSPDEKKLIFHRGAEKYAIRGASLLLFKNEKVGGEKKADAAFKKLPPVFLNYANKQWAAFGVEKLQ